MTDDYSTEEILRRNNALASLPWKPHVGPPLMTHDTALAIYRAKRSQALSRTVMTEDQRANFVGDAKNT